MTKFETLYQIADKITDKLEQLFYLTSSNALDSDPIEKSTIIEELKILVIKESELVTAMALEDVDICLTELKTIIENNFEVTKDDDLNSLDGIEIYLKNLIDKYDTSECQYDANVLLRAFDRLKHKTYILCGEGVRLKLTQDNKHIMSYEISVWDATKSILNIEVSKQMKNKIFQLRPSQESDKKFIKDLKFNLECFIITALYANFASEIQALHANNDIDKIVIADIDKLIKLGVLDPDIFSVDILDDAKILADELSGINIDSLEYNPECIFYFLRIVTSFEVLISHMDAKTLKQIRDYCQSLTNDKNYPCMSGINNFVKSRIKKKDTQN